MRDRAIRQRKTVDLRNTVCDKVTRQTVEHTHNIRDKLQTKLLNTNQFFDGNGRHGLDISTQAEK